MQKIEIDVDEAFARTVPKTHRLVIRKKLGEGSGDKFWWLDVWHDSSCPGTEIEIVAEPIRKYRPFNSVQEFMREGGLKKPIVAKQFPNIIYSVDSISLNDNTVKIISRYRTMRDLLDQFEFYDPFDCVYKPIGMKVEVN